MRKHLCALVVCFVSFAAANDAVAGGRGEEHPYAADHIEGLPADVRRAVLSHERACGGKAAATHYFSVSISTPTQSFVSLHFENLSCPNGGTLCTRRAVSTRFMLAGTEDIGASSASMPRTFA